MSRQFGTPTAPEGCGTDPEEGACYACTVRAAKRGHWFWRLRQLVPLRYVTHYTTGGDMTTPSGEVVERHPVYANFDTWRMWLGKIYSHENVRYPIAK